MESTGKIIPISIEDEMKTSYLNYAMSVIVSRALPDVRDGLKPVHRRILYSMYEMGLRSDRSFKKCGRIVGDVLGKYHPHGDQSIYGALVRLAQEFSLRYPMVNGQGNFGSIDGDPPAAMRYTEAKLQKIADDMLNDIKKETVDFGPNYDDSMIEPLVLPAAIPNLLVNGASGIAVGMATNMAPHNLEEVSAAIQAYIDDPEITVDGLMEHITGPDFPTGALIFGKAGIKKAYKTGRGRVTMRARCSLETTSKGKDIIIVTQIPYAVNKVTLITRIAELVSEKKLQGISDLRDESDRDGIRIVIELKRGAIPRVVLNKLFMNTQLQQNFNINALALVDGKPRLLTLKDQIHYFVKHRKEVITRRTQFDLRKAREREHILLGLKIALDNIDEVIAIIKSSKTVDVARTRLRETFELSEKQAQAILDMRLQKLTSLETQKILDELAELKVYIEYLEDLLANEHKILGVIKDETIEISEKYGNKRSTEIVLEEAEKIDIEDMIKEEDMVVLISGKGFIKRLPVTAYKNQGRGGKGSSSANLKNDDFIEHLFVGSTHDYVMFITSTGKSYWMKIHEIPEGSRAARGTQIKALVSISPDEEIKAIVSLKEFSDKEFIFMGTRNGIVKKVKTSDFSNAKTRGIIAVKLDNGDSLVDAVRTSGDDDVFLVTKKGNALRFHESSVRTMGRATRGVTGIKLNGDDELAGFLSVKEGEMMFVISEYGYGKRTEYCQFNPHGRGTRGQKAYKVSEKTGELIGVLAVCEDDELVCITSQGNTLKLALKNISVMGKNTQGVRVVNINSPDSVIGVARVIKENDEETINEATRNAEATSKEEPVDPVKPDETE
ncbi:MAG: DNA topoisomerase (ATP-hydrolyzing) subunit A [Spirochaetales bacterium]|uniref:DNA gyrase subunit A n=1 Tax=Candidatus Thalassospirochaeta sargassi TaxID=3119039 RepID=A0AAJ1IH43_9SPIO|nr:DNA topoisomerase (ATP-hydrolyzing) subunit A [Spirochaetales bacterium]